ncbi:hypothetical protein [Clostridium felsineum]|uniref:Uncharacterized protein n=1 Tax=Clostridium felsineum TaxID=36839 RepID=A0A1S8KZS4_9CLOT|nr:hypothetical protein [Clostridium felsineum]URZ06479.1 hypothetical protein CLROS_018120 [Clostridium felsineum]URZ11514.1 hypothetical protein CROST_022310 [Clostridium felsineum]
MSKQKVYEQELEKLNNLFKEVEESRRQLTEGLIESAAFLFAENKEIEGLLNKTGMIKVHPKHPELQKNIPAAEQYRKNLNSYSIVIKSLNSVLDTVNNDDDDDMDEFE